MIEFHADDYGLFSAQSALIRDCIKDGAINGVSIMPNSPHLGVCMAELRTLVEGIGKQVAVTAHLNLVEGRCLADAQALPDLVDKGGVFRISFGQLLLASFLPGRRARILPQLKSELRAQIHTCLPYMEGGLRLDGHCHFHMLPVVLESIMTIIHEDGLDVRSIRLPEERLGLYLGLSGFFRECRPVNAVKTLVLHLLCWRARRRYREFFAAQGKTLFSGVLFSGNMNGRIVRHVLGRALRAKPDLPAPEPETQKAPAMEILFHPGGVYEAGDFAQLTNPGDRHFLSAPGRRVEAEALVSLVAGGQGDD